MFPPDTDNVVREYEILIWDGRNSLVRVSIPSTIASAYQLYIGFWGWLVNIPSP